MAVFKERFEDKTKYLGKDDILIEMNLELFLVLESDPLSLDARTCKSSSAGSFE